MKKRASCVVMTVVLFIAVFGCGRFAADKAAIKPKAEAAPKAQAIVAAAEVDSGHPEIEPGLSCNDCHEIKVDANTTATKVHLFGKEPAYNEGEGVMPKERVWAEIEKAIGGIKDDSKTFILATSLNNVPLSTTCEWTLDPKTGKLYGFHEPDTEKLRHIESNPKVSLNYHKEFDSATFKDFLCVQIRGTARLLHGDDPDFERIMIELLPYEFGARVPADATPEQRDARLKAFRQGVKKSFVISEITPEQITIVNQQFRADGMRLYQRWTR